jgi:Xaa-Pro aminopeptidase
VVMVREFAPKGNELPQRFGKVLGRGAYRVVYPFGRDKVVKFERDAAANVREWAVWQLVKDTHLAKYLCPIYSKSSDDCTLIQARCYQTFEQRTAPISRQIDKVYWSERRDQRTSERLRALQDRLAEMRDEMSAFAREVEQAFRSVNILAYDLHEGNVGYDKEGNMIVLDYGNFYIEYTSDGCQCSACRVENSDDSVSRRYHSSCGEVHS